MTVRLKIKLSSFNEQAKLMRRVYLVAAWINKRNGEKYTNCDFYQEMSEDDKKNKVVTAILDFNNEEFNLQNG